MRQYLGNLYTHSLLFDRIRKENQARILEVGCGSGIMSIFLSLLGHEVTCVDNNNAVLNKAKELNNIFKAKAQFLIADAFNLEGAFNKSTFDISFSQGLFEHFDDNQIRISLGQQLAVSRKVIISIPSKYYPIRDFGNERLLSIEKWSEILEGFDITCLEYYGFYLPWKKDLLGSLLNPLFYWKTLYSLIIRESSHILIEVKGTKAC